MLAHDPGLPGARVDHTVMTLSGVLYLSLSLFLSYS